MDDDGNTAVYINQQHHLYYYDKFLNPLFCRYQFDQMSLRMLMITAATIM